LKTQKATAPARGRPKAMWRANSAGKGWTFCSQFVLVEHLFLAATIWLEVPMTVEKQREVIRLWNQLRKLEGPAAEELRIQILECFSEKDVSEKNLSAKNTVNRAA
jgi:hypothetical protein